MMSHGHHGSVQMPMVGSHQAPGHHGGHHGGHHPGYQQPYQQQHNPGSLQLAPHRPAQAQTQPLQTQPLLTPKVGAVDASNSSAVGPVSQGSRQSAPQLRGSTNGGSTAREQALEQKLAELEALVTRKDQEIKELHSMLAKAGLKPPSPSVKVRQRDRVAVGGFRKVAESEPQVPYEAQDQDDPVDMRLEEFYNSTGSAVSFRRINKGFYRFGDTIVELNIINHKLMARTEDGWNRSKFGPVEKFLMYYENIEREKAGVAPEP